MEETGVGTLVVVDDQRRLQGLLTERDVRFVGGRLRVAERMTPRSALVVQVGPISLADAERVMTTRKIKKLPLVNADEHGARADHGQGSAQASAPSVRHARRARPAARGGRRRRDRRLSRARRGGASRRGGRPRDRHRARPLERDGRTRSSSCASGTAASSWSRATSRRRTAPRFLLERGVNGIKVGIGPGGGCTTRLTTNFGVPQVEALGPMPRGGRRPRPAHRRRRHPPRRRDRAGAAVRRRHRDARQRVCRHGGNAGRHRAEAGADARVAEDRARAVQGVPRHGVDRRRARPARSGGGRSARGRGARRRGTRGQRAGARVGAPGDPRHAEALVLGDQLRRRRLARGAQSGVSGEPGAISHQAVRLGARESFQR